MTEDEIHFSEVLETEVVINACERNSLTPETYPRGPIPHNAGMKFRKDAWVVARSGATGKGVDVHFEARHPGEIRVDVEIYPYEARIDRDPLRQQELRLQLDAKENLIRVIRKFLLRDERCKREFGASDKHLRAPSAPATLGAVKFHSASGSGSSVQQDAEFIAAVLHHVTPLLDTVVVGFGSTGPRQMFNERESG